MKEQIREIQSDLEDWYEEAVDSDLSFEVCEGLEEAIQSLEAIRPFLH